MKCSLGISNFLEEISSLSHSIVLFYFFALITKKGFLISTRYSLELCIQRGYIFPFLLCFLLLFSQLFVRPQLPVGNTFFSSTVQSLSCVRSFATPWTAAHQASLSINSLSLLKLMSFESVMPSNHFILCRPLLPPSIFPSIRVFSNESTLHIRWPKYWSFSLSISPSNEY